MNNRLFTTIIFVILFSPTLSLKAFLDGNQLFYKGNFLEAIELYKKVENPSPYLLFNLGSAYFNVGNYAEARLAFIRAHNLGLNTDLYQKKIDERLQILQEKSKIQTIEKSLQAIPLFIIQLWMLICFGLLFYGLYRKKGGAFQLLICIILFLGSTFWWYRFKHNQRKEAVIMNETDLYAGPERSFLKRNVVPLGTVVHVLDQQKDMVKIAVNRQRGWISSYDLTLV